MSPSKTEPRETQRNRAVFEIISKKITKHGQEQFYIVKPTFCNGYKIAPKCVY